MAGKCTIIQCIDYRTQIGLIKLTQKKNCLGQYYLISVKGSSRYFINGREDDLLDMIGTAGTDTVIIIHHEDCKSYSIKNPIEEKTTQFEDMRKAEMIIKKAFPEIKVIKLWAKLDEEKTKINSFQEINN
ncbi:MAG: hypothetical protein PHW52_04710 [Candidatus Pacebacteria bacterium]|nr:hypothetical protein [Candidatus Paceibacterota bacterium]